ncbi:unnamed protein product [Chilo suppressalis]|uniref:PWWP domain-containing protein n=1 Tax=Chilo suppressalis TaxID=168631 RepID=A0ABN8L6G4_CHISP|nr:unnamed protein product [Chilo suppressalis]
MDDSEDNSSAGDTKMRHTPSSGKSKQKKRSLVERELETNLTAHVTSPVTIDEVCNTSRYGRALRVKKDSDFMDTERFMTKSAKSPTREKIPETMQSSPVYKMHASNSPIKGERGKTDMIVSLESSLDSQIENIYNENMSLSRFGSSEKKRPSTSFPKVYVRKDLIQNREKDDTVHLIKNMFSPGSGKKSTNSHLKNILERSSEKYNLKSSGKKSVNSNAYMNTSSVVKTLDFDNNKNKRVSMDKVVPSKSDLFDLEARCEYQVGDLAWARMGTYPFWPCIVTREPSSGMFVKKKLFGRIEHDIIHVTFFGDNGRRSWIVDSMLRKFLGQLEFEATREHFGSSAKKRDPKLYAAFFVSEKKMPQWSISVEEAETLLREPKRLRIEIFNDMLAKSRSMKAMKPKSGKISRTSSNVSLSESLYDTLFSENGNFEDLGGSKSKTRRSLDVSEVVTACLDNMAAKSGITKIQKQSHMDIWLQKAKSKTPEKSQVKHQVPPKEKEKLMSSKRKRCEAPKNVPLKKPYSLRKSYESQNLTCHDSEHDYSGPIRNKSGVIPGITFGIITKVESLRGKGDDKIDNTEDMADKTDIEENSVNLCESPTYTQDYDDIHEVEPKTSYEVLDEPENVQDASEKYKENSIEEDITNDTINNDISDDTTEIQHILITSTFSIPSHDKYIDKSNISPNVNLVDNKKSNSPSSLDVNGDSLVDSQSNHNNTVNGINKIKNLQLKLNIDTQDEMNNIKDNDSSNHVNSLMSNGFKDTSINISIQSITTDTDSSFDNTLQNLEDNEITVCSSTKPRDKPLRISKKRSLRLKNRSKPKNSKAQENDAFAKYVEYRKDTLIDEYPHLSHTEIMDYLSKTWQYEQGDESKANKPSLSSNATKEIISEKSETTNPNNVCKTPRSKLNSGKRVCAVSLTDILLQSNISVAFRNGEKTCIWPIMENSSECNDVEGNIMKDKNKGNDEISNKIVSEINETNSSKTEDSKMPSEEFDHQKTLNDHAVACDSKHESKINEESTSNVDLENNLDAVKNCADNESNIKKIIPYGPSNASKNNNIDSSLNTHTIIEITSDITLLSDVTNVNVNNSQLPNNESAVPVSLQDENFTENVDVEESIRSDESDKLVSKPTSNKSILKHVINESLDVSSINDTLDVSSICNTTVNVKQSLINTNSEKETPIKVDDTNKFLNNCILSDNTNVVQVSSQDANTVENNIENMDVSESNISGNCEQSASICIINESHFISDVIMSSNTADHGTKSPPYTNLMEENPNDAINKENMKSHVSGNEHDNREDSVLENELNVAHVCLQDADKVANHSENYVVTEDDISVKSVESILTDETETDKISASTDIIDRISESADIIDRISESADIIVKEPSIIPPNPDLEMNEHIELKRNDDDKVIPIVENVAKLADHQNSDFNDISIKSPENFKMVDDEKNITGVNKIKSFTECAQEHIKLNGFNSNDDCTPEVSEGEFNAETSSIHSEDSEPLSTVKSKLQFKNRHKINDINNPEFLKYMDLRQDALMDEHPELSHEELVKYMYKTWLYEESTKSDFMKTDDIAQSGLVKGLDDNLRQKSIRNSFRASKKRKHKSGNEDSISVSSDTSDVSIKRKLRKRTIQSPVGTIDNSQSSFSKDSSPERKNLEENEVESINCDFNNESSKDLKANVICDDKMTNKLLSENKLEIPIEPQLQKEAKVSEKPPPQCILSNNDCKPKKYFDIFNQVEKKHQVPEITINDYDINVKEEYDPETVSIDSEDSEVSLTKRKQRKNGKQLSKDDPDFLKYVELRQDALIDENSELTHDEIVSYLFKTWLYEESVKSDIKKSDEIDQASLIKGLNPDTLQPKKVRKKTKADKELTVDVVIDDTIPKDKPKRKSSHPFYIEDDLSDSEDIEVFDIFKSKKKLPSDEVIEVDEDVVDQVDLYFKQLTKPKPNVFKGLVREKVCGICERTSNLVKCKGCSSMFHVDCIKKEDEVKVEASPPVRGRKKKKKLGRKPKNLDESGSHSDDKSQDISEENNVSIEDVTKQESYVVDAENFESVLEVKMKELIPMAGDYYSYSNCDGIHWNGTIADKCNILLTPKIETDYSDFKCNNCQIHDIPVCFVCKSAVSKTGVKYRQRCQTAHCHKYYHMECLDHWPQTQFQAGELCKTGGKVDGRFEEFMCPIHVCHTCVSDDPRGCKTRFCGDKLARCVRCPATYHSFTKCLPAGSQILTASHIVCPRHYEQRPGKVSCHVNTGWCFICALGGSLICCEYCPTSFHAECLNIKPPEGGYMCEDCETGRLPLYGEMVWVKLGHYRWWPGLILHPSEIPDNIMAVKHSPGEFVVRFFGQYDHYWVKRGRVFPFQEGDSGRISSQKSKIDAAFTTAMEHAQRACEIMKAAVKNDVEDTDIASSLLPPHYVKLKVNKPVGSVCSRRADVQESSLTQCDCSPDVEDPCGPYSHCLNRMLLTECGPSCRAGDRCNNRAFEKRQYPRVAPYRTPHRGWGLRTLQDIAAGQFVIEYVGELIDEEEFRRRMKRMHEIRDENFYFLTLDKERMIDAGPKGNLARFMNHCCEPNCETQKWTVLGDVRVGLFAIKDIPAMSELTFNYNLECAGIEKKRCLCGAKRCSGYIGAKPKQDEQPKKSKRTYKKRKPTEESPSTSKNKPKRPVGRPAKPRELTEIEKDLLIIKNATNGLSSDSECSGRLSSIESDRNIKALKRKRVSFSTDEFTPPTSSPNNAKRVKLDDDKAIEVGD